MAREQFVVLMVHAKDNLISLYHPQESPASQQNVQSGIFSSSGPTVLRAWVETFTYVAAHPGTVCTQ